MSVTFRAVDLSSRSGDPSANGRMAFMVQDALQLSELLDKEGTKLSGQISEVDSEDSTFTFDMSIKVKPPVTE